MQEKYELVAVNNGPNKNQVVLKSTKPQRNTVSRNNNKILVSLVENNTVNSTLDTKITNCSGTNNFPTLHTVQSQPQLLKPKILSPSNSASNFGLRIKLQNCDSISNFEKGAKPTPMTTLKQKYEKNQHLPYNRPHTSLSKKPEGDFNDKENIDISVFF